MTRLSVCHVYTFALPLMRKEVKGRKVTTRTYTFTIEFHYQVGDKRGQGAGGDVFGSEKGFRQYFSFIEKPHSVSLMDISRIFSDIPRMRIQRQWQRRTWRIVVWLLELFGRVVRATLRMIE